MEDDGHMPMMILVLDGRRFVQVRTDGRLDGQGTGRGEDCLHAWCTPNGAIPPHPISAQSPILPSPSHTNQATNAAAGSFFRSAVQLAGDAVRHRALMSLVFSS